MTLDAAQSLRPLLPEIVLTAGLAVALTDDLVRGKPARARTLGLAALSLLGAIVATLATAGDASLFSGAIVRDAAADAGKILTSLAGLCAVMLAWRAKDTLPGRGHDVAELVVLLLSVCIGASVMAAATDVLVGYLALETASIGSYVLVGFSRKSRPSAEAALKYVIYGGVASGVMVYGLSLAYGLAGSTDLATVARALAGGGAAGVAATVFVLAGLGFKVALVPFHMWVPDAYEGAPTPVAAFLSVGPKAGGFLLLARFALAAPDARSLLSVLAVIAVVTITLGNLAALGQRSLKRLLAYSSIAHAGTALVAVAAGTAAGERALVFYLGAYLVMNVGAFATVHALAEAGVGESVDAMRGLGYRAPLTAVSFAVFLVALVGLPPTVGFVAKLAVLYEALARGGGAMWVLALALALNTAISLAVYARVLRAMFLLPKAEDATEVTLAPVHLALILPLAVLTLLFGVWLRPLYALAG